ncbi:MAG: SdrD B-like domain-containing protein, partial [Patescibacteria group bacterium]
DATGGTNRDGGNTIRWNFGGHVTGTVWSDVDGDGSKDGSETTGLSGVTVTLTGTTATGSTISSTRTTTATGAYAFHDVMESTSGGYTITLDADTVPAGWENTTPTATGAVLGTGATLTADFGFTAEVQVTGAVFFDWNGNGQIDAEDGNRLSGATLTLTGTSATGGTVNVTDRTDVHGVYLFTGVYVSSGYYLITSTPPTDAYETTDSDLYFLQVTAGGASYTHDFGYYWKKEEAGESEEGGRERGGNRGGAGGVEESIQITPSQPTHEQQALPEAEELKRILTEEQVREARRMTLEREEQERAERREREVRRITRPQRTREVKERIEAQVITFGGAQYWLPESLRNLSPIIAPVLRTALEDGVDIVREETAKVAQGLRRVLNRTERMLARRFRNAAANVQVALGRPLEAITQSRLAYGLAEGLLRHGVGQGVGGGAREAGEAIALRIDAVQKGIGRPAAALVRAIERSGGNTARDALAAFQGLERRATAMEREGSDVLERGTRRVGEAGRIAVETVLHAPETVVTGSRDALAFSVEAGGKLSRQARDLGTLVAYRTERGVGAAAEGVAQAAVGAGDRLADAVVEGSRSVRTVVDRITERTRRVAPKPLPEPQQYRTAMFRKEGKTVIASLNLSVFDSLGNPYSQTPVVLFSTPKIAVTNESGIATFHEVETGTHQLEVHTKDGPVEKKDIIIEPPSDFTVGEKQRAEVVLPMIQVMVSDAAHAAAGAGGIPFYSWLIIVILIASNATLGLLLWSRKKTIRIRSRAVPPRIHRHITHGADPSSHHTSLDGPRPHGSLADKDL